VGALFDKIPRGKIEKDSTTYCFKNLLKHPPQGRLNGQVDPMKDLAYILYTGGTTGFPKGVPGNHLGMISYVRDIEEDVVAGLP